MTAATITLKLREPNFGRPQPEEIKFLAITRIPTYNRAPVFVPVTERAKGAYWSVQPSGTSGNYWRFTADLPAEFDGLRQDFGGDDMGDFVVTYALEFEGETIAV